MIKTISIRELRPNISTVFQDIHEKFDRYIVNRRGKPEIMMMSIEDYESLVETIEIESDKKLMKRLSQAEKEIKQGKGKNISLLRKELNIV